MLYSQCCPSGASPMGPSVQPSFPSIRGNLTHHNAHTTPGIWLAGSTPSCCYAPAGLLPQARRHAHQECLGECNASASEGGRSAHVWLVCPGPTQKAGCQNSNVPCWVHNGSRKRQCYMSPPLPLNLPVYGVEWLAAAVLHTPPYKVVLGHLHKVG